MKIGIKGTVAAIVRQGDYFVTVSSPQGIGFEYAPDGGANAPVVGAIAARKGRAMFLDAHEASEILARYGSDAENQLILRMELPGAARGAVEAGMSLSDKLERAIRARSTVASPNEQFDGTTLGSNFNRLSKPREEFNAPGGMMIDLPIWNSPNWTIRSPATTESLNAQPVVLMSHR